MASDPRAARSDVDVMTMAAPKVVFSRHTDIRDALADPALTRRFDPRSFAEGNSGDRPLHDGVLRWGLSFGFGPHQCPGRSSAVRLPVPGDFQPRDDHLYGLVPLMVQAVVRRGVRRDPDREPRLDDRSERRTFARFPVIFDAARAHA